MLKLKIAKNKTIKVKYKTHFPNIISANLQEKEVTPTKEEQLIEADLGYDGLKQVLVNEIPDNYIEPTGTKEIVENGIYEIKNYENVDVNVEYQVKLQQKSVEPTKELQEIIADETYDGLEKVNVMPIAEEYIIPSGELNINENGQYDVTDKSSVNVDIESTSGGNVDDYFNTSLSYTKDTFLPWNDTSTDYTYLVNEEHTKVIAGVSSTSVILVPIEEKDNYNTRWQITANSSNWRIKNIDLNYYLRVQSGALRLGTSAGNWTFREGKMTITATYTTYYLIAENDVLSVTTTPADGQIFESYKTNGMVMKEDVANSYLIKKYIIKAPTITIPDSITTLAYFCTEYRLFLMPKIIFNDNITTLQYMFNNCINITNIDTSSFNTKNVTTMANMFYYCSALTSLDLSSFETLVLTNASNMFYMCRSLKYIDMRNFDFTNVTNYSNMFGASAGDGVPNSCEIIVKDDIAKEWITSKFTRLTNVKTIAEYEME